MTRRTADIIRAHTFWSRLFGTPEEINGANRCPTYLYRWIVYGRRKRDSLLARILGQPLFKVYLHHFVADDWSLDLHDHPKRFISIGLKGGYIELTPGYMPEDRLCDRQTVYSAPWIRTFPARHIHRLQMFRKHPDGEVADCWTLVIVLRSAREWGFWHLGKFIHWREYVKPGATIADEMKACGE
jgi:hypothetical protein